MKGIILGASGFLGKKIYSGLKKKYELIGIDKSQDSQEDKNQYILDVTDKASFIGFLENKNFDFVIDTVAIADPEECIRDKEKTRLINIDHVIWLCDYLKRAGKKLIYISSDFVFDGSSPPYSEDSLPLPINFYGETKLAAEKIVLRNSGNVILRLQVLYGYNSPGDKLNFFSKIYKSPTEGKTVYLDDVRKRCPTFIDDVPGAIGILLEKNAEGIYHLCNSRPITHYEFGLKVAKEFGMPTNLIKKKGIDPNKTCKRPLNNHLTCEKIEKLGCKISNIDEALKKIHQQMIK